MFSIHDTAALEQWRIRRHLDPEQIRRLRNAFYKKGLHAEEAILELPTTSRAAAAEEIAFHSLQLHSRQNSQRDGASKLIFQTARGLLLESVILRIGSGRTSLCVSSQSGCAARCTFCATGMLGLAGNLTRDEILDQVVRANQFLRPEGRAVRNVVFMGMGEPLHNEREVYASLSVLLSPRCFYYSPRRVLVSTVGIPDALARCASNFPQLGLALSLHSARQEIRESLIPLARRYPLDQIRAVLARLCESQHRVMIEYLLLADRTDTDADLAALLEFLQGLQVHVNLIPYNAIDAHSDLRASEPLRQDAFAAALKAAGLDVTVRYSLGTDIAAACGQLVRQSS